MEEIQSQSFEVDLELEKDREKCLGEINPILVKYNLFLDAELVRFKRGDLAVPKLVRPPKKK